MRIRVQKNHFQLLYFITLSRKFFKALSLLYKLREKQYLEEVCPRSAIVKKKKKIYKDKCRPDLT
jgi:hypothetical protein